MAVRNKTRQDPDPAAVAVSVLSGVSVLTALWVSTVFAYSLPKTMVLAGAATLAMVGMLGVLSPTLLRLRSARPGWVMCGLAALGALAAFGVMG